MPEIFNVHKESPKDLVKMHIQYKLIVWVHKHAHPPPKAFGVYLILSKFYSIANLPQSNDPTKLILKVICCQLRNSQSVSIDSKILPTVKVTTFYFISLMLSMYGSGIFQMVS